jgi:hypothetical protein
VKMLRDRSMWFSVIALAFIMLAAPHSMFASTWYVRPSSVCSTNGNGSAQTCAGSSGGAGAWSGFSNISWGSVHGGDTLYMVSGDTFTNGGMTIGASGSSGNPITISVTGGGTVTIDQNGQCGSGCIGFNLNRNSYVVINGVIGQETAGQSTYGIRIINQQSTSSNESWGVYDNPGGPNTFEHIEVSLTSSTAEPDDNGGGFYLEPANGEVVEYNWVHGPSPTSKGYGTGITMWTQGGSTSFTLNLEHDNEVENMYNDGIRCGSNCSMYNNVVRHVDGSGHSDSLLTQSSQYVAIYNNYVEGSNDQNCYLDNLLNSSAGPVRVYNNVFNSPGGFGGCNIDPEGGSSSSWNDVEFINNTSFASSSYTLYWSGRGSITNLYSINNIYGDNTNSNDFNWVGMQLGSSVSFASGDSWDYDVFSTVASGYPGVATLGGSNLTIAQLQALSPAREVHAKAGVPSYVNPTGTNSAANFALASSDKVAFGAGENLSSVFSYLVTDAAGNPRPSSGAWDTGAFQTQSTASRPNPPTNIQAVAQ